MSREIQVNFELTKAFTWGITKDQKYDYYSVPVVINDPEILNQITELANDHNAKNPLYGKNPDYKTLYLQTRGLSTKQRHELLDKGRQNILINFEATEIKLTKNNTKYISFKITKLGKREKPAPEKYELDDFPNDF